MTTDEQICLHCGATGNLETDFAEPGCCNLCVKVGHNSLKHKKAIKKEKVVKKIRGAGFNHGIPKD